MLNSKASTYPILRVKPLEISCSSVKFFSDRDDDLLVSEEIGLTEELGFRQCELPTSEEYDKSEDFHSSRFRPLLR
jgi:hypothetical protein